MSSGQNIKNIQSDVEEIERYVAGGVWEEQKDCKVSTKIMFVDHVLQQLMLDHTRQDEPLPDDQLEQVESLRARLEQAKGNLPAPPL